MTNPQLHACITLWCNILQGIKIWSLIRLKLEAQGEVIRSCLFLSTAKIISSSYAAIIRMCNHYNKIFRDLTAWIWMRNKCHNTCCRVWSKRREQLESGKNIPWWGRWSSERSRSSIRSSSSNSDEPRLFKTSWKMRRKKKLWCKGQNIAFLLKRALNEDGPMFILHCMPSFSNKWCDVVTNVFIYVINYTEYSAYTFRMHYFQL